jgi:serine protease AprX
MKKLLSILVLLALASLTNGQVAPNKYYVQFTDKNNSPYSIDNPQAFLSQRAIDRRQRQDIQVTVNDIPVNPSYIQGIAATGAVILNPTKWLNGVTIFTDDPSVLDAIAQLPYVAGLTLLPVKELPNPPGEPQSVKPFFKNEIYNQAKPQDLKSHLEAGSFDYGGGYNQIHMIKTDALHDRGYRGQGMVIAVIDAGFLNVNTLPVFDSLWLNDQILGTRDFVDGGPVTFQDHPHGAMVLSTMGGNMPGELIGTAPKASFWLLRSEDGNSENLIEEYNWASAAEYADSVGADVINSSLGYTEFDDPVKNHTYADMDGNTTPCTKAADFAASKGMLVCISVGNSGSDPWYYLSAPSDGDSVIAAGAVDENGDYVYFSSHGPSYDGRIKPDVATQGSGVWVADPYGNGFTYSAGTSFSSPILAGSVACLLQANYNLNNMQIREAIWRSSSQYQSPDDMLGYGIPDFQMANDILMVVSPNTLPAQYLAIFPNPYRDRLFMKLNAGSTGTGRVEVFDYSGRLILNKEITVTPGSQISVPGVENLRAGLYLLKLTVSDRSYTERIVKE